MKKRIVVTGMGCITALGKNVADTWNAIKEGRSGIHKISSWNTEDWEYSLGAEINDFDPKQFIDRKLLKLISRHDVMGIAAADQAIQQSSVLPYRETLSDPTLFNEQTGLFVASPGNKFNQQYDFFPLLTQTNKDLKKFGEELNSVVHPMWLLRNLPNNVLAHVGILNNFKGANQNIVNHSVGGSQAILEATHALKLGTIERAVVVSYDSTIEPQTQMYYAALGVLSKQGIKSFDQQRDGTVLAEGAGSIMLETLESAEQRGAKIYGEIIGGACTSEAMGIFSIREDGAGLEQAIDDALQKTGINVNNIGMITAHANGTKLSDHTEANVYSQRFSHVPITGFKWALGHTIAGAGVIETIMSLCALNENIAPGIRPLQSRGKDCGNIKVSAEHQSISNSTALVVNRGFGSINSCLLISHFR